MRTWLLKKRVFILIAIFLILFYFFSVLNVEPKISTSRLQAPKHVKNKNLNITLIIVVHNLKSIDEDYSISIPTIKCYTQANNYSLLLIDFSNKSSFYSKCDINCKHCPSKLGNSANVKFARHCIVAEYLADNPEVDYVLAMDADTGVINPHHRIEDYIDPSFDLIFHERRYNYEIQAATYIAKNTEYTKAFLHSWTNLINEIPITIVNADNPALHQALMEHNFYNDTKYECKSLWKYAQSFNDIRKFVYCTRIFLGFETPFCCNSKIKFYFTNDFDRPAWSRDGWLTDTKFSDNDFMFHDWKTKDLTQKVRSHWINPFTNSSFAEKLCTIKNLDRQWKYKNGFKVDQKNLTKLLKSAQEKWRNKSKLKYLENIRQRRKGEK